jgi:putative hydrolase of HD superfamily
MLGLIACALAAEYFPQLDVGLVAQAALVHDVPEGAGAGDTPTLRMLSADAKVDKRQREHEAFLKIREEFDQTLPWLPTMIGWYEALASPEARFVKAVDKLLPKITHILNGATTIHKQGMTRAELVHRYEAQVGELEAYAADFPELFKLRSVLVDRVLAGMP